MNIDSPDKRFYGVYRGFVYSSSDPENQGRIQIVVPQVLGSEVTEWAYPIGGSIAQKNWPYGTFFTTADQNVGTSSTTVVNWDTATSNKIELDDNKFNIEEEGDYLINLSAVVKKDSVNFSDVSLWIKKNGVNVPNSGIAVTSIGLHSAHAITAYAHVAPSGGGTVSGNHTDMVINHSGSSPNQTVNQSFILNLLAGDYIEFACSADVAGAYLNRITTGAGSASPGMAVTINLIGEWRPQPNQGVWVMFEGGDPNFPLWIGGI